MCLTNSISYHYRAQSTSSSVPFHCKLGYRLHSILGERKVHLIKTQQCLILWH